MNLFLLMVLENIFILSINGLQYPYLITNKMVENSDVVDPLSNEPPTDNTNKLIIHYSFKEQNRRNKNSRKIFDSSGTGNDGLIDTGSLILGLTNERCTTAAYFYGTTLQVFGNTIQDRPFDGITVTLWYKNYDPTSFQTLFLVNGPLMGVLKLKVYGSQIFCTAQHINLLYAFNVAGKGVSKNDWVHLAASYDKVSGRAQLYVNSIPVNRSFSSSPFPIDKPIESLRFGDFEHQNSVRGFLTEIKVYNYAVPHHKIIEDYNLCPIGPIRTFIKRDLNEQTQQASSQLLLSQQQQSNGVNSNIKRTVNQMENADISMEKYGQSNDAIESLQFVDPY